MIILQKKNLQNLLSDPLLDPQRLSFEDGNLVGKRYLKLSVHREGIPWELALASRWNPQSIDRHLVMKQLWGPNLSNIERILLSLRPLDKTVIGRISKILLFSKIEIKSEHLLRIIDQGLKEFQLERVVLTLREFKSYEPTIHWKVFKQKTRPKPLEPRRIGVGYKDKGSLSGPSPEGATLKETRLERLGKFEDFILHRISIYPYK